MASKKKEKDFVLFGDLEEFMSMSLFDTESKKESDDSEDNEAPTEKAVKEDSNGKRRGRFVSTFNDATPKGKKKSSVESNDDESDDEWPDDDDDE